jgi:hypothetical protein
VYRHAQHTARDATEVSNKAQQIHATSEVLDVSAVELTCPVADPNEVRPEVVPLVTHFARHGLAERAKKGDQCDGICEVDVMCSARCCIVVAVVVVNADACAWW